MTVDEAISQAKKRRLDLKVSRETVPISAVEAPWHGPKTVRPEFVALLRSGAPWPQGMPRIIAACENLDCAVVDGSHRLEAAQRAGYQTLPIIAVSRKTIDELINYFREDEDALWEHGFPFDEILGLYAKVSSIVRENREKERAWDRGHR
jgi:hypothetical protein